MEKIYDNAQVCPPGYFSVAKILSLIDYSQYSLRLFSLLLISFGLVLVYHVLSKYLPWQVALLSVSVLGTNQWVNYFATEFKQYSADFFCTCLALNLLYMQSQIRLNYKNGSGLVIIGCLMLYISHVACIVLFALGITMIVFAAINRRIKDTFYLCAISGVWVTFFSIIYLKNIAPMQSQELLDYHQNSYFSLFWMNGGGSLTSFVNDVSAFGIWLFSKAFNWKFAMVVSFVGAIFGIVRLNPLIIFSNVLILTLVGVSALGLYPWDVRFVLGLFPAGYVLFALGFSTIAQATKYVHTIHYLCIVSAIYFGLGISAINASQNPEREEIIPAQIAFINLSRHDHMQSFIASSTIVPYEVHEKIFELPRIHAHILPTRIVQKYSELDYLEKLKSIEGYMNGVFLVTHNDYGYGPSNLECLENALYGLGLRVVKVTYKNAELWYWHPE